MPKKISEILQKKNFFIFLFLFSPLTIRGQASLLEQLNDIEPGFVEEEGELIFNGVQSPNAAVEIALDTIGLAKGYGTAGIDPFRWYTKEEYERTLLFCYASYLGRFNNWPRENSHSGWSILADLKNSIGDDVIKRAVETEQRLQERNEYWATLAKKILPTMIKAVARPIVLGSIIAIIGLPIAIWHASKAFFGWVFVPRPTVLGPNDSDIFKWWWQRLRWKEPENADFIADAPLEKKMGFLKKKNKNVSAHNRKNERHKIPYQHVLCYGSPGTGKTLFAKTLAGKSNMHFMYFSVSDLCQLSEEKALSTLKNLFQYARSFAPCVLIVDECDRMFAASDEKAQKLGTLFQKEFSKSGDTHLQLFLITNYPWKIPKPIINRTSPLYRVHFSRPSFSTQKRLFAHHLERAFSKYGNTGREFCPLIDVWLAALQPEKIKGLVGRDIETISNDVALRLLYADEISDEQKVFFEAIEEAQEAERELSNFCTKPKKPLPPLAQKITQIKKWTKN